MAASSNIVIDPKPFISLSKELKDIRDVLIDSREYSATIEGSIRRIEKGGFLDFVSKSALQTGKVKDKDPEVSTALKKLANFLDQKVDRTKEQKIETPTEKIVQPTIFKSIIQNTHKLVEDITSKSIEEHKKTKYTESGENKNNNISNILSSQLKQLSNLFNKKSEPVTQKALNVQPVQQDKQTKDVSQTNNGTLKQITALLDANKTNKADIKNVDIKKDDNSLPKILKSIESLASSKKDETPKSKEQDSGIFKKLTAVFESFKDTQNKNLNIKVDDSALQKVIKSFSFFSESKETPKKENTQSIKSNEYKSVEQGVKQLQPVKSADSPTKQLKVNQTPPTLSKDPTTTALDRNDNVLIKKLSAFFDGFKTTNTLLNKSSNLEDTSLQKVLKSFALLKPSKTDDAKPVLNKPTVDKAITTNNVNNRTTQNINFEDTFLQKILKALDQKTYQKDKETTSNKQYKTTDIVPTVTQPNTLKTLQATPLKTEEVTLQKVLKSIELLKPSKREDNVKTPTQGEDVFKRLTSFVNDFKAVKSDIKNVDVKKDDNSLQKILKSIEFLKPGKKEESVKTTDQSDTLFKKMTSFLGDVKAAKSDTRGVDIKKDDNSLQKILKSIEFLKPGKKEESVKQTDQSDTLTKKLSAILNEFKSTKSVVKNVDINKDDNSLQKILKSIEFLKPSKKEESVKTPDQSDTLFKKMSSFFNDVNPAKSNTKNVDIKKDDNSLQKILKSIEFLKPGKKEEDVKTPDQSDTLTKKLTAILNSVKPTKSVVNSVDVKKDDSNSLQKILKSIEFLKPGKKEESVKQTDQSDTLFKKMTSFLGDVKAVKSDVKNVDIKKDDNSLQKILKSIEFLKPGKKEESVKTTDQSDTLFKKMSSAFNSLKPTKDDVKNIDVKKDDNSLQKILKSIEYLKPSKKEEDVKPSDQSQGLFKKLTSFLKDSINNKTEGKNVDIKSDDSSLQKVLKSVAFLRSSKKKEETSDTKTEDTQEPPKPTKQSFISSSITAVKEKLTNAFLPKSANNQDKSYNTKDNVPATPNIVERINSLKTLNEKQSTTGQDKDNTKPITPVAQKIVEQKTTVPVVTQLQPQTVQATSAKLAAPLATTKPEGEAQKELFAKEDINEKILKTLEHIDHTAKEILKAISGKHEDMTTKKESKKENEKEPQSEPSGQSESSGTSPLDLLDLIPGKLRQRARIFAKKGMRAARRVFTKGKTLVAKGGSALKSATGKAITAGKTLINKAAGTAVGKTVAKGATALKTTAGTVLEKGSTAVKSVTGKALEAGKGVVSKITNTGVVKNAGETLAKGTSAIKTTAGTMLEKGSTAVKNVTSKALEAGKDIASKVASPETVKTVGETVSKGASNIKTAASNMIEKGGSAVKNVTGKALEAGKGLLGKIVSTGAATAGTGVAAVGQAAQAGGTISRAAGLGTSLLKSGGKALGFLGKAAKAAGSVALKVGKAIPGVGGVIGTGMAAYGAYSDIQEINEKVKNGEMTEEEATVAKSKAIGKGIGSAAGSFIPGVGGLVGDLAGGYIGDKLGGVVGNALVSNKKTGEQNTPPAPELSTSTAPTSVATDTVNNTSSTNQPQTVPANSATPPATTAVNSTPSTPPQTPTELKPSETPNTSKEVSSNTPPALDKPLKPESLWDKAKNIGTKAIQYATPVGAALTAGTAIYNKLTTPTTTNAATPQTTSIPTPSVAKGADSHQALKQVAEGIASSNSNDKDLAASILKMSEALVSAGLMKAPPIELNNIIQGNNSPPKIDLESVFGNNNDPIRSVRGEFAV